MKKFIFVALILLSLKQGHAQQKKPGGTMPALKKEIKNATNALSNTALAQAKANFIQLENDEAHKAIEDLKANMPYADFVQKYACKKTETALHVTRFTHKDNQHKTVTEFTSTDATDVNVHKMSFTEDDTLAAAFDSAWLFKYYPKTDLYNEVLQAFYFTEEFYGVKLPAEYTGMLAQSAQYADTMQNFLKQQKSELDQKLLEAKQMETQWLLLSSKLADNAVKRKRRELLVNGIINCLPVLLLSIK